MTTKLRTAFQITLLREQKDKPQIGKKMFAKPISDKGLVFRIYEEFSKFGNKKNKPIRKGDVQKFEETLH